MAAGREQWLCDGAGDATDECLDTEAEGEVGTNLKTNESRPHSRSGPSDQRAQ